MKNLVNISDEQLLSIINRHPLFNFLKTNLNLEAEDILNVMKDNPFFDMVEDTMYKPRQERKGFCKCQDPLIERKSVMKVDRKDNNLNIKMITTGYKNEDIKVDFSKKKQHIRITAKPNMPDAFQMEIEEYIRLYNEIPKNITKTSINGVTTIVITLEKVENKENMEYIHLS